MTTAWLTALHSKSRLLEQPVLVQRPLNARLKYTVQSILFTLSATTGPSSVVQDHDRLHFDTCLINHYQLLFSFKPYASHPHTHTVRQTQPSQIHLNPLPTVHPQPHKNFIDNTTMIDLTPLMNQLLMITCLNLDQGIIPLTTLSLALELPIEIHLQTKEKGLQSI